ncbi:hypothetical protein [Saccharothrix variisporea]|uniref:hypothetical protein n=1 Tax=Saccharothrix variisporea TaxID=543527 RepID=UPI0011C48724|nr:hypothetical protein [Saccharothrix variisporea]
MLTVEYDTADAAVIATLKHASQDGSERTRRVDAWILRDYGHADALVLAPDCGFSSGNRVGDFSCYQTKINASGPSLPGRLDDQFDAGRVGSIRQSGRADRIRRRRRRRPGAPGPGTNAVTLRETAALRICSHHDKFSAVADWATTSNTYDDVITRSSAGVERRPLR